MTENTLQRIKQYIDAKGIKVSTLEREVGMSNGSFASQLKNNKTIGVDKLENILRKYTDVDPEWLLTGNGTMFKGQRLAAVNPFIAVEQEVGSRNIPLYNVHSISGIVDLFGENQNQVPVNYISIPEISECDGALYVAGDSMYPLLNNGDIVIFKKINTPENNIIWGEMYLVYVNNDGNEFFLTRFLNKSKKESYIEFVSQNPNHQTVEFPVSSIKALALVKASIRVNAQF
ncbi:LexA family transcriptional regulator [Flavobacterium phragmitis]|uniref:Phage repressor protein C, contains Cro/C1-type HTH and peptisase s24 domains n=1 Tax=Flavobacterium phragmitis TaxID=739143 RepID=A0A1I1SE61_9FLAO|nr:XRE family transcriptional regulator [Flavobacterium phragmitis]SFD44779.1 Phage repressor protein C, contains Cro/C1-type HTH and peptisase s24 domains [Flavobacterium phragmitis]